MAIDMTGVYAEIERILADAVRRTEELAAREFVGEAADGRIRATISGAGMITDIRFRPRATQELDTVTLGEAVVEAVNLAEAQAEEQRMAIVRENRPFGVDTEAFLRDPTSVIPRLSTPFDRMG